jgi:hypothetical protein
MAVFAALAAASLCMQLMIAVGQTHLWMRRERRRKETVASHKDRLMCGRRLPIVPLLAAGVSVVMIVMYALVGLNVVNTENGGGTFFLGLILALYGFTNILLLLKFVSLGSNIIMPSVSKKRASAHQYSFVNKERQAQLSKFDAKGKLNLALAVATFFGMGVCCCVIGLVVPNE